jgi:hypothetical protein
LRIEKGEPGTPNELSKILDACLMCFATIKLRKPVNQDEKLSALAA